jgi:hypothetical protein
MAEAGDSMVAKVLSSGMAAEALPLGADGVGDSKESADE